ncbi:MULTISPECIES: 5-carboxymethyl-2-hydroxymuconate Delta-isomerase [unclassified Motilimonas]|uniref:5-carboxymethyl-2-hydroxymuconate Delta-isomerase n=1 Tax=Motilimonas TaxID=1914248 RepID=UPI001E53C845|nr:MULTISPECIES: 5-carboxymethyl-2-hydroxymuconate Delta-isomerase [unclassified Motilimonas]MCE0559366.1 5-carboxymethyl-2-hydroxymuconate Delta-isomerase [Motilimonas sp. E26]MDO6528121.1 5-carboxymethyl-2-hydroxymuconate Delta-isomerase [Motilimonas sp. 1_MG-2023]
MPHLVMEYSQDLESSHNIPTVLNAVHNAAKDCGYFTASAIKSRAHPFPYYRVGDLDNGQFIHLTVSLLKGRTSREKYQLSQLLCRTLTESVEFTGSVSVDVQDVDEEVYSKRL